MEKSNWFLISKATASPKLRLFCFPYAGGSPAIFNQWSSFISKEIDLVAINPPGRGNRISEPPIESMDTFVKSIVPEIKPLLDLPFIFFGHSLGSRVAFEVLNEIKKQFNLSPVRFIASGSRSPNLRQQHKVIHNLPHNQFLIELERLGGVPKEFIKHRDLVDLLLPMLKADFKIAADYQYDGFEQHQSTLSLFAGTEDQLVPENDMLDWKQYFKDSDSITYFKSDHFFIDKCRNELLFALNAFIIKDLKQLHLQQSHLQDQDQPYNISQPL